MEERLFTAYTSLSTSLPSITQQFIKRDECRCNATDPIEMGLK